MLLLQTVPERAGVGDGAHPDPGVRAQGVQPQVRGGGGAHYQVCITLAPRYFKKFHLFGILGHKFLQDPSEHVHRHNLCLFVVKLKSQTPLLNGIFVHTIELIEGEKVGRVHKPPRKVLNFKNIFLLLNHCTCFFLFLLIKLFALVKITFLPSIKLQRKI